MVKKKKMGRPADPGKVVGFYAPRELLEDLDKVLEYTGGTISAYLRGAVEESNRRVMQEYKEKKIGEYLGGSIEPPK